MYVFDNLITLDLRPQLEEYLNGFEYRTSGTCFTSLYMWRDSNEFNWQVIGDYLCLAGISYLEIEKEEAFLFPPLTKTGRYDPLEVRKTILEAKRIFTEKGQPFSIRLIPKHMLEILEEAFPGEFEFIEDRPNYDYVYLVDDLIRLPGRKYSAKRNHLRYFHEHFKYQYVPLTSAMADDAMQFIKEFNERKHLSAHEMDLLKMEEDAMREVFHDIEKVGYIAGAIMIDGKIEALSIGGRIGKEMVDVHVEKANTEFRGLYQAINNEFCIHEASQMKYVNREEDMDIAGLRKAKLSYKPVQLLEKYIAVFKADR
jgi:hypothetical protein